MLPLLLDWLQWGSELHRSFAIKILGNLGSQAKSAEPLLRQLVLGNDTLVSSEASVVLGQITGDWDAAFDVGVRLFHNDDSLAGIVAQEHWMSLGSHARFGIPRLEAERDAAAEPVRTWIENTLAVIRNG